MSEISPSQCRAARALLGWTQQQLATAASTGLSTIKGFELGSSTPYRNNMAAIRRSLEEAGVDFIPENGGGAGVRLRRAPPTPRALD